MSAPRRNLRVDVLFDERVAAYRDRHRAFLDATGPEALHDLRVAARRLLALNRLLVACDLGSSRLKKQVRQVLQASSGTRDLEVQARLAAELGGPARRGAAQGRIRQRQLLAAHKQLRERLKKHRPLPSAAHLRRARERLAEVDDADLRLDVLQALLGQSQALRRALKSVDSDTSTQRLHRQRLRIKRLRYVLEIAEAAGWTAGTRPLQRQLAAAQDTLGELHDRLTFAESPDCPPDWQRRLRQRGQKDRARYIRNAPALRDALGELREKLKR